MKTRPPLPEGPFLVVGLARSGAAVAQMLQARGESVRGVDGRSPEEARRLIGAGVEVVLDAPAEQQTTQLSGVKTVVKSPGVPAEAPVLVAARERGIAVLGELEVAWRAIPNRFCAVTGTNGKTTTVELLGHIHRTAGEPVAVAGNVGTPLASLAGRLDASATVVCECSSFQLEDAEGFAPETAALLNVTPDHLDRHGDFESYLAAKLRIFANQGNDDVAVYDGDDPLLAGRDLGGCARRVAFCGAGAGAGAATGRDDCQLTLRDGVIFYGDQPLIEVAEIALLGRHNVANAMAAAAAALAGGIDADAVRAGLRNFPGVPHRLERIVERSGVIFVNDSKATNPAAAAAGLRSFDGGIQAILGGSLKGDTFESLADPVAERCRACYLIGDAAEQLARDLAPAAARGVPLHRCDDLEAAVRAAAAAAKPGEVVLLSPACASFDAYEDFEQRGEHFREIVGGLA
ncbi:MAG: UDP-N-acetylmuramoylalanine--D-glutamate ligase [Solirubrobacterales bacterium]|jgi:UDP-N-acetylmuramoylalanine--D-glutamate ligase|nr:UDP-N-acetylmuramoylalanine--D-glutamate ligase [Solirubrobacterales bacterium]